MKLRIVKITNNDYTYYVVEKKFLWFWLYFECHEYFSSRFDTLAEAEAYFEQKKREIYFTQTKEVIKEYNSEEN